MISEVYFLVYMSNVTLPGVSVIQNIKSASGCGMLTTLADKISFFYDKLTETCLVHPRTPTALATSLISKQGSTYYLRYVDLQSCARVQLCDPNYNTDGEYWLYPAIYNYRPVKIYCKGMNTPTPSEYLTLQSANFVMYPNQRYIDGTSCSSESYNHENSGRTTYYKIGVDVKTMTIIETDSNFTQQIRGEVMRYGWVQSCSGYTSSCDYKGMAVMSVTDTGLILSGMNEWIKFGTDGEFSTFLRNDHQIVLKGDGECGGGKPKYPIKLEIDPSFKPSHDSATEPVCVY
ncbi:hypothetical protein LOTGIDRAFT_159861 [Lottia gigantea]|uniref:GON domain-containing protein n=1 Tax=Lottia gigantea TaxID=225164 RepID=V4ANU8_LOTGI|nr:hypothetical protein LOTGIDRAFT_159861 [Lottia gigantea]ESO96450.1 hypothetical protein LOTGIDRAFT_159861 [Lottia gigantea]